MHKKKLYVIAYKAVHYIKIPGEKNYLLNDNQIYKVLNMVKTETSESEEFDRKNALYRKYKTFARQKQWMFEKQKKKIDMHNPTVCIWNLAPSKSKLKRKQKFIIWFVFSFLKLSYFNF